jgi:hypothetical protein
MTGQVKLVNTFTVPCLYFVLLVHDIGYATAEVEWHWRYLVLVYVPELWCDNRALEATNTCETDCSQERKQWHSTHANPVFSFRFD